MHSAHQVHQQVCTSCTRAQGATRKGAQEGCCRVSPQCSFGCMASSPLSTRTQNEEDRSLEYAAVGRVFSLPFFPRTEPKGRRELLRIPFVFCSRTPAAETSGDFVRGWGPEFLGVFESSRTPLQKILTRSSFGVRKHGGVRPVGAVLLGQDVLVA